MLKSAQENPQRIVLPEGTEIRTLKAADKIIAQKAAKITLIGKESEIKEIAEKNGLKNLIAGAKIVDPESDPKMESYANLLYELRKKKGMTPEQAAEKAKDPLYLGCLMIKSGDADGEVAGAMNSTGNVLRPAFQIIKTVPGVSVVSGAFLMISKHKELGENGMFIFSDCASMPDPTAQQLAEIAVSSADSAKFFGGFEPRVAMLSFSTKGSAKDPSVDKVVEATKLAHEMAPNVKLDGELQLDAAIIPEVGEFKAPGSSVAGKANVLIFPNLNAGNIGYKLVQRFGDAIALGPVLQGMAAPVNDLSRGCSVEDVFNMILITTKEAIHYKSK